MKSHLLRILLAVAAGILLLPLDASAQTSAKVYRIGLLEMTPPDLRSPNRMAFYEELRKRGYVEGQNLVVERRNAAGQADRLPALARELVALRPDLIVAVGAATQPCRQGRHVDDPDRDGCRCRPGPRWARREPRPARRQPDRRDHPCGGRHHGEALDLLHQIVPKATRIAVLVNPTNEMHRILVPQEIPEAARQLGVQIHLVEARTADEIEPAINAAVGERAEALYDQW